MPETGNVLKAPVYKNDNQTTKVFLQLPPEGSVFVVLREQSGQKHIVSIVKDYEANYPVEHGDSSSISPVDLMENQANEENMILFQEGKYTMETESGTTDTTFNFTVSDIPSPIELSGPWDINFPSGWRAPSTAVFPELISWTVFKEEGIKYFSGIETYRKVFDLPGDLLKPDNVLYLDLEIAAKKLNFILRERKQND